MLDTCAIFARWDFKTLSQLDSRVSLSEWLCYTDLKIKKNKKNMLSKMDVVFYKRSHAE